MKAQARLKALRAIARAQAQELRKTSHEHGGAIARMIIEVALLMGCIVGAVGAAMSLGGWEGGLLIQAVCSTREQVEGGFCDRSDALVMSPEAAQSIQWDLLMRGVGLEGEWAARSVSDQKEWSQNKTGWVSLDGQWWSRAWERIRKGEVDQKEREKFQQQELIKELAMALAQEPTLERAQKRLQEKARQWSRPEQLEGWQAARDELERKRARSSPSDLARAMAPWRAWSQPSKADQAIWNGALAAAGLIGLIGTAIALGLLIKVKKGIETILRKEKEWSLWKAAAQKDELDAEAEAGLESKPKRL